MRVVFRTSYDRDIDLHQDGIHRAKYALLLAAMAALPFVVGQYYLAEATNTPRLAEISQAVLDAAL